jgi:hypothetical protein
MSCGRFDPCRAHQPSPYRIEHFRRSSKFRIVSICLNKPRTVLKSPVSLGNGWAVCSRGVLCENLATWATAAEVVTRVTENRPEFDKGEGHGDAEGRQQ